MFSSEATAVLLLLLKNRSLGNRISHFLLLESNHNFPKGIPVRERDY